jgi:hypothetical protein
MCKICGGTGWDKGTRCICNEEREIVVDRRMTAIELVKHLREWESNIQKLELQVTVIALMVWLIVVMDRNGYKYGDELLKVLYKKYLVESDPQVKDALFHICYEATVILARSVGVVK